MARTLVTNTSGANRFFGFLPPHGKPLADGHSVTVDGDLRTVLASGMRRYTRKTELAALDGAVARGEVEESALPDPSSSSSA
jgi:hypothetical protein